MKNAAWKLFGVVGMALSALTTPAFAQDNYPAFPVRMVIGFPPGGASDLFARLLAQKLSTQMNTNVIVENKEGATGNIAADYIVKSKPDGYAILFNTNAVILSRALGEKVAYDILKDLAPVSLVASVPLVLSEHPSVPANNAAEFISHLKSNPDKLAYGSAGNGNISHLTALLFLQANSLVALHVPYKGSVPAMVDLIAGRVQFAFQPVTSVLQPGKDKRIRLLAITGFKRSPLLPDVPTVAETIPGFEFGVSNNGVLVPAKTPPAIIKRLNGEIVKAMQDQDMKARLTQEGAEALSSTPEEYGAQLRSELDRWTKGVKSAGLKSE